MEMTTTVSAIDAAALMDEIDAFEIVDTQDSTVAAAVHNCLSCS